MCAYILDSYLDLQNITKLHSPSPGNAIFLVLHWMILPCMFAFCAVLLVVIYLFYLSLNAISLSNHCMIFGKLLHYGALQLRLQSTFQKCPFSCSQKHVPQI